MVSKHSKEIRSTVTSEGNVELSIVKIDTPTPTEDEVLIEISAAPINPSDLALLTTFGGDLSNINISGTGEDEVILTLYKKGLLKTIYITDKSSKNFRLALKRIVCNSLSRITISEYFNDIKRLYLKTGAKPEGDKLGYLIRETY